MYKYRSLEAWRQAHAAVIAVLKATDTQRQPKTWVGSAAEAEALVRVALEVQYLSETIGKEVEKLVGEALKNLIGLVRRRSSPFPERVP